jgi:serine/threonine-protein kinase
MPANNSTASMQVCESCKATVPVHAVYCPSCGNTLKKKPAKKKKKMDPLVGTILDHKYRLVKKIGEGGMALIYRAEHIFLKEWRAIKIIKKPDQRRETQYGRFLREARLARKVSALSPHVIRIDDFGYDQKKGMYYYSMELLEGKTLREALRKRPPYLKPAHLLYVSAQVCKAMDIAHQNGMIHRDLKPDNIYLITQEGYEDFVKIIDFGLARPLSPEEPQYTDVGKVVGTPEYMSPEQCRGPSPEQRMRNQSCVDARSDVYSLGVIMYQCLAGRVPFSLEGEPNPQNFLKLMSNQISKSPKPLRKVRPETPREVAAIIEKAMQKDPKKRFQTMYEMQRAIMQLLPDTVRLPESARLPKTSDTPVIELTNFLRPTTDNLPALDFSRFKVQLDPELKF